MSFLTKSTVKSIIGILALIAYNPLNQHMVITKTSAANPVRSNE